MKAKVLVIIFLTSCQNGRREINKESVCSDSIKSFINKHFYDPKYYESISTDSVNVIKGVLTDKEQRTYMADTLELMARLKTIEMDSSLNETFYDSGTIDRGYYRKEKIRIANDGRLAHSAFNYDYAAIKIKYESLINSRIPFTIGYYKYAKFRVKNDNGGYSIHQGNYILDTLFNVKEFEEFNK